MNGYFPQTIELLRSGRNSIGLLLTVVGGQGLKWQSVLRALYSQSLTTLVSCRPRSVLLQS